MARALIISLNILSIAISNGQSLYNLAPSVENNDTLPLTDTTEVSIGYDSSSASVAESFVQSDPASASAWLDSIPSSSDRDSAIASVAENWLRSDPQAAQTWLQSLPDSERDQILRGRDRGTDPVSPRFPGLVSPDDVILGDTSGSGFSLTNDSLASSISLVTDAALALDDRFGFENKGLSAGQSDIQIYTFHNENQSSPSRRHTTGIRADLDFAVTNNLIIGGEFFYSEGDSSRTDFDAKGFGLDASYKHSLRHLDWEIGLGAGLIWGDLTRSYSNTLSAESDQEAQVFTAHTALRNSNWSLFGLEASWELGLKQRFVRQNATSETGASSLNLSYSAESLHTTLANLELGLSLSPKLKLELALNPVLYHQGGSIEGHGVNSSFSTSDFTGYDVHTARATLIFAPTDSSTISTDLVIGSEHTWSTNLGYRLRF